MSEYIAVLNAGSSSIKFALYDAASVDAPLLKGQVDQIGLAPHLVAINSSGERIVERSWPANGFDHASATDIIIGQMRELATDARVVAVGHRVVHGGTRFTAPIRVDAGILAELKKLSPLAPLHQPHNLAPIRAIADAAPAIVQVACFDTAFHCMQPALAQLLALPRKYTEAGIRRYGFHGLSYEYVLSRLQLITPSFAKRRIIIAHLGNGASLCAVNEGRSVATTMGFTALDGLVMGTRCGALDPGVILHLIDEYGLSVRELEDLLYRQSGLLGVSGISSDMRALRASSDPSATEAIALFVYRIVREIGSLVAALGGLDGLVFTGGIGEHDAATRRDIATGCRWLGIALAEGHDELSEGCISTDASVVPVWVVPTDEERMVALHTKALLHGESQSAGSTPASAK